MPVYCFVLIVAPSPLCSLFHSAEKSWTNLCWLEFGKFTFPSVTTWHSKKNFKSFWCKRVKGKNVQFWLAQGENSSHVVVSVRSKWKWSAARSLCQLCTFLSRCTNRFATNVIIHSALCMCNMIFGGYVRKSYTIPSCQVRWSYPESEPDHASCKLHQP